LSARRVSPRGAPLVKFVPQIRAFSALLRRLSWTYWTGSAVIALAAIVAAAITVHILGHVDGAISLERVLPSAEIALLRRVVPAGAAVIVSILVLQGFLVVRPVLARLRHEREIRERGLAKRHQAVEAARAAAARLIESETRFRSSFDSAAIGMAIVSFGGRLMEANRSLAEMLGHPEELLAGMDLRQLTHPDDLDASLAQLGELASGRTRSSRLEQRYRRRDGAVVWALLAVGSVLDADGRPVYAVAQIEDITARKRAEENAARYANELRNLALTDDLTSVYNRRGFRVLAERICLAQRRSDEPLMLVAVDLDRLKMINDTWGHAAGDRALLIVATALASTFRTSDVIGRMGGDEFLCLLPNAVDVDPERLRARLGTRMERLTADLKEEFPVTATIGIAVAPPATTVDLDNLVREADRSLYDAKHARTHGTGHGLRATDIGPGAGPQP
jgi:diguanylate cyclase (GGDEF)-like protein/PAS domain S-box-containing protein